MHGHTFMNMAASAAAVVLRVIPKHRWRKRYAKTVGPMFEGCVAKTSYGFPMITQWHNNVNRIGFEGSLGVVADFISSLPRDASYIDIGANQGFTSIMASNVLVQGIVTCFEPSHRSFEVLAKNIALNGCTNIRAREMAVSQEKQSLFLDETDSGNTGANHIAIHGAPVEAGPVEMRNVWDQSRFSGIFIKVDTEGYELVALKGLEEVLASGFVQKVVVEINEKHLERYGATSEQVYQYLKSFGLYPEQGQRDGHYDEVFDACEI